MSEWNSGNIFIRPMTYPKGKTCVSHRHNFDHTTFVMSGSVRVRVAWPNGQELEQEFFAPAHFLVRAGCDHEITALEDDSIFWCVYAHRNPQGEIVQQNIGWNDSYV